MVQARMKRPVGRPRGEQVENAARRRRQLIEAAIDSIVEVGFSATTLATVSRAAGLSQGVAVFYFKRKEFLLIETLRYHYDEYDAVWRGAVAAAGADPLDKLMALIFADLDPTLCTPRNLTLWNSFWGETAARPQYRIICEERDAARREVMVRLCGEVKSPIVVEPWKPKSVADALDIMTDGMWTRMHIEPSHMSLDEGRRLVARFLVTVFPSEAARIQARAESPHR